MSNAIDLAKKTFFVVSGASRGIGRAMAIECAAKMASGSVIALVARSASGLEETKAQILAKNQTNVTVHWFAMDLTRPNAAQIANIFETALNERNIADFEQAIIIHNVGTIGDVTKWAKVIGSDADLWNDYFSMNVFSVTALNTAFLNLFETNDIRRLVVNVTSKLAEVPCKSLTLYWYSILHAKRQPVRIRILNFAIFFFDFSSGKAAREMYFRVLALEEAETDRNLTILNYSPGPVQTEMTADIEANSVSNSTRSVFIALRNDQTYLQPIETTLKFIKVIEGGAYESGAHIDFYDA